MTEALEAGRTRAVRTVATMIPRPEVTGGFPTKTLWGVVGTKGPETTRLDGDGERPVGAEARAGGDIAQGRFVLEDSEGLSVIVDLTAAGRAVEMEKNSLQGPRLSDTLSLAPSLLD